MRMQNGEHVRRWVLVGAALVSGAGLVSGTGRVARAGPEDWPPGGGYVIEPAVQGLFELGPREVERRRLAENHWHPARTITVFDPVSWTEIPDLTTEEKEAVLRQLGSGWNVRLPSGFQVNLAPRLAPGTPLADLSTSGTHPGDHWYGFPDGVVDVDDLVFMLHARETVSGLLIFDDPELAHSLHDADDAALLSVPPDERRADAAMVAFMESFKANQGLALDQPEAYAWGPQDAQTLGWAQRLVLRRGVTAQMLASGSLDPCFDPDNPPPIGMCEGGDNPDAAGGGEGSSGPGNEQDANDPDFGQGEPGGGTPPNQCDCNDPKWRTLDDPNYGPGVRVSMSAFIPGAILPSPTGTGFLLHPSAPSPDRIFNDQPGRRFREEPFDVSWWSWLALLVAPGINMVLPSSDQFFYQTDARFHCQEGSSRLIISGLMRPEWVGLAGQNHLGVANFVQYDNLIQQNWFAVFGTSGRYTINKDLITVLGQALGLQPATSYYQTSPAIQDENIRVVKILGPHSTHMRVMAIGRHPFGPSGYVPALSGIAPAGLLSLTWPSLSADVTFTFTHQFGVEQSATCVCSRQLGLTVTGQHSTFPSWDLQVFPPPDAPGHPGVPISSSCVYSATSSQFDPTIYNLTLQDPLTLQYNWANVRLPATYRP